MATAPTTGNTLLPPVRLTGNARTDGRTRRRYLTDVYQQLALQANILGTQAEQAIRIATLEAQVVDLTARVKALEGP